MSAVSVLPWQVVSRGKVEAVALIGITASPATKKTAAADETICRAALMSLTR